MLGSTPLHFMLGDARQDVVWAVHRGTGKIEWTWNLTSGWPKGGTVEHVVSQHDRTDQLRGVIAVDEQGNVLAFRMYGFIPTPAQEKSGLTSRSMADQATAKAKAKDAKPAEGGAKPADAKPAEEAKPAEPAK